MLTIRTQQGRRIEIVLQSELCDPLNLGEYVRAYCHIHGSDHQRSLSINKTTGWGHCFNAACNATVLVAEWNPTVAKRLIQLYYRGFSSVPSPSYRSQTKQSTVLVSQPILLPPEIYAEVAAGRTGRAPVAGRANAQGADPLPTSAGVPERTRHSPERCVGFRRPLPATGHDQQPGGAKAARHSAQVGRTHPFPPGFSRRQGIHRALPVALAARHGRECPQVAAGSAKKTQALDQDQSRGLVRS